MHGCSRISLRCFLAIILIAGTSIGLFLSYLINRPIDLNQNAIGYITSPAEQYDNSLTYVEFVRAFKRRQNDGSVLDSVQHIVSAEISLIESSVDPPRDIPRLGFAETHRDFYLCKATCVLKDGDNKKLNIKMEKNHFHLVDLD